MQPWRVVVFERGACSHLTIKLRCFEGRQAAGLARHGGGLYGTLDSGALAGCLSLSSAGCAREMRGGLSIQVDIVPVNEK